MKKRSTSTSKKEIKIINRKLLESLKEYYGQYPFYGSKNDSTIERYKWLKKSHDGGALYYKNIVVNIIKNLSESKDKIISVISNELNKLHQKRMELESNIEDEKTKYLSENESHCPEYRLVKIYTTIFL